MRIAFISEDWVQAPGDWRIQPGGCTYYRCMLPRNAAGPTSKVGRPAWTGEHGFGVRINAEQAMFGFDQVVMKQMMDRWVPAQMERAKELGQRLIVDVDDHYDGLHEANKAYKTTDPAVNRIRNREHFRRVIELADVVTVTTPFLRDYYEGLGKTVVMIRNGINPNQFTPHKQVNRKPVIGWAGAMAWRSNDAEEARPWLGEFLQEHDVMFHHAGHMPDAPPFWQAAGIPRERVITSPMRGMIEYQEMLDLFDIGVVLLSDIPFNHAKSCLKGLEYAASNIPFVTSPSPEYEWLEGKGVGRVAHSPDQWKKHLGELLDWQVRKREAARQRQLVLSQHTIRERAVEWAALFASYPVVIPVKTQTVRYGS